MSINYSLDLSLIPDGMRPYGWTGSCLAAPSGFAGGDSALLIGDSNNINVCAAYPRMDMTMPSTYEDRWVIEFKSKMSVFVPPESSPFSTVGLWSIGSIDQTARLKFQITQDGYLSVYPYKTSYVLDDGNGSQPWHAYRIECWDVYFNVYVDDFVTPLIQYAIPMFDPYWQAGQTRINLLFESNGANKFIIDDFTFYSNMESPTSVGVTYECIAMVDNTGAPAAAASCFMVPASTIADQITDSLGRFSINDIPPDMDVFIVYPSLSSAIILASDVELAKQRRLVSGITAMTNVVQDDSGSPVSGARLFYINPSSPDFYTDEDGRFSKIVVSPDNNVLVKTTSNETRYLDSSVFV